MRLTAVAVFVFFTIATPLAAQGLAPQPGPYNLDPYKPSDAALLRNYGAALVAQTPLLHLSELDPYKPSHAALLRQIGGAIPLWSHLSWYPTAPAPAPLMTAPSPSASIATLPGTGGSMIIVVPGAPQRPGMGAPARPLPVPPLPPQAPRVPPDTSIQRAALQ